MPQSGSTKFDQPSTTVASLNSAHCSHRGFVSDLGIDNTTANWSFQNKITTKATSKSD